MTFTGISLFYTNEVPHEITRISHISSFRNTVDPAGIDSAQAYVVAPVASLPYSRDSFVAD